jgi:hypothetical protein
VTSMTQRRSGPVMLRRAGGCRRPRYPHPDVTGPPVTPTTTRLSRGRQESPSGAEGDVGHLGGCRKPVVRPSVGERGTAGAGGDAYHANRGRCVVTGIVSTSVACCVFPHG